MKKIIALALALVMMLAVAIPAFAEETTSATQKVDYVAGGTHANKGVEVSYGIKDSYTLTLPSAIAFNGNAATANISLSDVKIPAGKELNVAVSSMTTGVKTQWTNAKADTKDAWDLIDINGVSDPVEYWLTLTTASTTKPETGAVAQAGTVLTVAAAQADTNVATSGEKALCFNTAGTAQTGDFRDILTFSVTLDNQ